MTSLVSSQALIIADKLHCNKQQELPWSAVILEYRSNLKFAFLAPASDNSTLPGLPRTAIMIRKGGMVTVNPFSEAWKRKMGSIPKGPIHFGPFEVTAQVFLKTPLSFALVNLKPLLPGHVLICPYKPHRRLTDLSPPELTDLFQAVQKVQRMLARHYFVTSTPNPTPTPEAGSFNIAIQDGAGAGQTVPHLHVHVIPRIRGATDKDPDGGPDDRLYELMAAEEGNVGGALWDRAVAACGRPVPGGSFPRIEDSERGARSMAEMEAEAEMFRGVLRELEGEGEEGGGAGEE